MSTSRFLEKRSKIIYSSSCSTIEMNRFLLKKLTKTESNCVKVLMLNNDAFRFSNLIWANRKAKNLNPPLSMNVLMNTVDLKLDELLLPLSIKRLSSKIISFRRTILVYVPAVIPNSSSTQNRLFQALLCSYKSKLPTSSLNYVFKALFTGKLSKRDIICLVTAYSSF